MAKITRKNASTALKLTDVLRKKKISLDKFIKDFGINSYESLKMRCERMGVVPPVESKFNEIKGGEFVNSPTEGILVLEAPKVINEKTGEELNLENIYFSELENSSEENEKINAIELLDNDSPDLDTDADVSANSNFFHKKMKKIKNK